MKSKELKWTDWIKLREELFSSSGRFIQSVKKLNPGIREKVIDKGAWSPKDVLSHIVGWDIEVEKKFKEFIVNPDADDEYDIDAFNTKSVAERKDKSWNDVMDELNRAQAELSKVVNDLSEDNINSDPRFIDWVKVLIGHYDHHRIKLEHLLDG
ncbi:MAG: ClbS/DfsB family four-helix bundle protein [Ignavibacteria bacterium]|jgi:hypothetical protein